MKKKYLEFYKKCMKTGKLPHRNGLCMEFSYADLLRVTPTSFDYNTLVTEGLCTAYWGSGLGRGLYLRGNRLEVEFTPLRQNIVLLLAAMNNEL